MSEEGWETKKLNEKSRKRVEDGVRQYDRGRGETCLFAWLDLRGWGILSFWGSAGDLDADHGCFPHRSLNHAAADRFQPDASIWKINRPRKCAHIWFSPAHDAYLKCMEEVALCLARLKRPVTSHRYLNLYSGNCVCYSSTPIKVELVRMPVITMRKMASLNIRCVNPKDHTGISW